ncbi:MAG: polyprenol monophosphomannose synthase [Bacteroidia bacterium]|nr:MAG: polyprenol monophosphomannose synthase [Bacteroidia bacterium]
MVDALVIIPTYNERENVEKIIRQVFSLPRDFHVLVVDDNSPDGTAGVVQEMTTIFPDSLFLEQREGKLGLGTAYIHGFKWALDRHYDYIFEMDADLSHNPEDLIQLYDTCADEGYDVAIGSRYIDGVNVVNWPLGRVLMSYLASIYVRMITRMPIYDTTAGFKCYRRRVLESIKLDEIKFTGYAFQIEMKFTAWKMGFRIKEVSIVFTDRTEGESKMSTGIFKEAVWGVVRLKWKSLINPSRFKPVIPTKENP